MGNTIKYVLTGLVLALLIGVGSYFVSGSKKEYVGGNVLHIEYATYLQNHEWEIPWLPLPWINNGLIQHLTNRTLFLPDYTMFGMTPDLASKPIEIINNGEAYKVTLKEGQKWSDGELITMDDVVFSIESVQIANRTNYLYKTTFAKIERLEVNGNELIIHMNERTTMLRPMLAQLVILPKHKLENEDIVNLEKSDFWGNPVVSGMYMQGEVTKDRIELIQNPLYTPSVKPKIEKVYLEVIDNTPIKLDRYHTNNGNLAEMVNFRAMREYTEFIVDTLFYRYFCFVIEGTDGKTNPAMQDIRVRQAICMSIDRVALLRNVFFGMGSIVNGAGIVNALGPYDYNPARAKELLAEAGYDFNRPLRVAYYYSDATSRIFMEQVRGQLETMGFKVELIHLVGAQSILDREYDFYLKGYGAIEASEWFGEYLTSHSVFSLFFGGHGEFDELLTEVRAETDPSRHAVMNELSILDSELLYKFPLHTLAQSVYINTDRVQLPKNINFGSHLYITDMDFANWEIKKQ